MPLNCFCGGGMEGSLTVADNIGDDPVPNVNWIQFLGGNVQALPDEFNDGQVDITINTGTDFFERDEGARQGISLSDKDGDVLATFDSTGTFYVQDAGGNIVAQIFDGDILLTLTNGNKLLECFDDGTNGILNLYQDNTVYFSIGNTSGGFIDPSILPSTDPHVAGTMFLTGTALNVSLG